jgi:hypothetical protein
VLKKLIIIGLIILALVLTINSAIGDNDLPKGNLGKIKAVSIFGGVEFTENIESYEGEIALLSNIEISRNKIKVTHKDLKSKKAKLTFKLSDIKNPILFRDGILVKDAKIKKKGLTDWEVSVKHFSVYEIKEAVFIGDFQNTTISSGNLTLEQDAIFIADFEDVEDIADKSIYANNIDDYTPSVIDQCKYGDQCYKFDGANDYLEAGHYDNSEPYYKDNTELSVCAWYNSSTDYNIQQLVSLGFYGSSLTWILYENGDKLRWGSRNGDTAYTYATDTDDAITNRWVSVCGTKNSTHIGLYVDGVIKASTSATAGFQDQNHELVIGGIGNSGYANPVGESVASIQCVQIFDSALSYDSIVKINNSQECLEGSLAYDTIVDAYTLDIGTAVGGDLSSLQTLSDSNTLDLGETATVPAIDVKFEFTGLSKDDLIKRVFMNVSYNGALGHMIDLRVLDVNSGEFQPLEPIPETGMDFAWVNATIPNFFNIIDDNGIVTFAINHTDSGDITHLVSIDYIGIELEQPISSWNLTTLEKTIPDHYGINDLDKGAFNNGTGTLGSIGALEFDGIDDTIDFLTNDELEWEDNQSHTFSYWANRKGDTASTVGTIYSDLSGSGIWIYIANDNSIKYRFDGYTCSFGSANNKNEWYYMTHTWNPTLNEMKTYIDGDLKTTCTSTNGFRPDSGSFSRLGSENAGNNYFFNGTLDEFKIFNRTLTPTEITALYNTNPLSKYKPLGRFNNITMGSVYQSETQANQWKYIGLNSSDCSNVDYILVRAGDCDTITGETYLPTIQDGCIFNTFNAEVGQCFQWEATLSGDTSTTIQISNYNISVNMTFLSSVNKTMVGGGDNTSTDVTGNATFVVNNTDQGLINFTWYVAGLLVAYDGVSGLVSGDVAESTLTNNYFSKGQNVTFIAIPIVNNVVGTSNQSTTTIIGNAGFSIIPSPTSNNISGSKPNTYSFKVTLTDVDNDVVCTWSVNGDDISTGTTFKYPSSNYNVGDNTISVSCTDGEFTHTNEWTINITETDTTLAMVLGVGIIAGLLLFFAFNLKGEHFFLKLMFIFSALASLMIIPATLMSGTSAVVTNLLKITLWVFRGFIIYFSVYFFYNWTKKSERLSKWLKR